MSLRPIMEAAQELAVRDRRTVVRRLEQLGVPVINLGGRRYYNAHTLGAALERLTQPVARPPGRDGTVLAPDERLWD